MSICLIYFPFTLRFLLCSTKCSELTFLATPTDLGTFPYFAESTLAVLGCMAFSVPIAKDGFKKKTLNTCSVYQCLSSIKKIPEGKDSHTKDLQLPGVSKSHSLVRL